MAQLLGWRGVVDLVVLATAIYFVLHWSREARALRLTLGILALEASAIVTGRVGLPVTSWVLHASALIAALILVILFQPELRHALSRLEISLRWPRQRAVLQGALEAVSTAMFSLAAARRGALIVIGRRDSVAELVDGGVPLGGQASPEILEATFRKVSPVHDGATLIEGDQIIRVGAILPLARTASLPRAWGTRHRPGMGLAERWDAPGGRFVNSIGTVRMRTLRIVAQSAPAVEVRLRIQIDRLERALQVPPGVVVEGRTTGRPGVLELRRAIARRTAARGCQPSAARG
jgi:diadenylate cyclase